MKKRLISMLLALLAVMGLLPTAAFAASTPEEALGEVQIYNGGVEMSYLSINGRIRSQIYTYYNYDNGSREHSGRFQLTVSTEHAWGPSDRGSR